MTQDNPTPPGNRTTRRNMLMTSAAAIAIVALAAGFGGALQFHPWTANAVAATAAVNVAPPAPATSGSVQPLSFANLVQSVMPAVVSVRVQMQQPVAATGPNQFFFQFGPNGSQTPQQQPQTRPAEAEGAGFFVSADGYIVTANHVVDNAQSVQVMTNDGTTYKAHVIGTDPKTDIAVIKVDSGGNFTYVKFADQMPRVGDWVVAVGSPFGLGSTVTAGIVSALARDIGASTYDNYLQIDAPINQGNSGGPTFDMRGNVVGINDVIFTPSGGSVGIGFDVPADVAKSVTASLIDSGHVTRGWLGIQIQDVTQDLADGLGLKTATGALVSQPEAGSPAAAAGIQSGDVITAVDGTPVKDSRGLAQAIGGMAPGKSVKLDILRHGTAQTIQLTLGTMPDQQQPPA